MTDVQARPSGKNWPIYAGALLAPITVQTGYLLLTRSIGTTYRFDWLAIIVSLVAGLLFFVRLPGAWLLIAGLIYVAVMAPVLFLYTLYFVCAAFGLCL